MNDGNSKLQAIHSKFQKLRKNPCNIRFQVMTQNSISRFQFQSLGKAKYTFIAITPMSTLIQRGSTCYDPK